MVRAARARPPRQGSKPPLRPRLNSSRSCDESRRYRYRRRGAGVARSPVRARLASEEPPSNCRPSHQVNSPLSRNISPPNDLESFEFARSTEELRAIEANATELVAWLDDCGVQGDATTYILIDDELAIRAPWNLFARYIWLFWQHCGDTVAVACDGQWILGHCHHDILTFGRQPKTSG